MRGMDIGGRDDRTFGLLVDPHDSIDRMLRALVLRLVAYEPQDLVPVCRKEFAFERYESRWQLFADAPAGRTEIAVGALGGIAVRPSTPAEHGAAIGADRRLVVLPARLIGIGALIVED